MIRVAQVATAVVLASGVGPASVAEWPMAFGPPHLTVAAVAKRDAPSSLKVQIQHHVELAAMQTAPRLSSVSWTAPFRGNAVVDTAQSVVRWRGTKFGGRGAHAGTVRLRGGALDYDARRAELRGGVFELDMRSIAVTDMPLGESEARRKLTTHLLAADFFDVQRHSTARFEVQRVTTRGGNLARLEGQLTLRGVTRPFAFDATVWSFEPTRLHATARATLDRMQWGVAFRGSRITNDLVDDLIHLEFDILARVSDVRASL
jgi:polyisoprenoid-binding protein YceI